VHVIRLAQRMKLGREDGFSLTELLVAIPVGVVLLSAVLVMMRVSIRQSANITDRTEAVQRGRTALERVTRQLRSQVCPTTTGSSLTTADANTLTLYVDMTGGQSAPERRTITYDPNAQTLTEYEYVASSGTWPNLTFPNSPTRQRELLNNVTAVSGVPFFRYYQYDANGNVSTTPMSTPVSAPNLPRVVNVAVSFVSRPRKASTNTPTTTFQGEASMRTSDPNNPTENARCL
jgi:prepilin-type N-terminal cleavage/methylation domain-containing protein